MGSSSSTPIPEDELIKLKCSECQNYLLNRLPITWYFDKGNVCGKCPKFDNIRGARNIALEKFIMLLNLPCRWENCSEVIKYINLQKHEEECQYRIYECPTIDMNCEWNGLRKQLENHFETVHPNSFCKAGESSYLNLTYTNNSAQHIFHKHKNQYFILRHKFDKYMDSLSFILFCFQKPEEQNEYAFMLTLTNVDETRVFTEKISSRYCEYVSGYKDSFDWSKHTAFEINLEKIAHFVKGDPIIKYSLKILED